MPSAALFRTGREMNAAALAETPFIESSDNLVNGLGNTAQTARPMPHDRVAALDDDIAVPVIFFGAVGRLGFGNRFDAE